MIRHDDTDMTVNLITADAKAKAEMWKLESTPRRREIADHVMELLIN